ncbi:MAG: hypothetical protein ACTSRR_02460 [Candidatus Heimdallarchaeaceae archaeon]
MSTTDVYSKLTSNLSQSIFSILMGALFSAIILLLFPETSTLILFIFEIPLGFLIALIITTECLYEYRDEISLDTTVKMIGPLFKSILISIPVIFLYSAIIIILQAVIPSFQEVLEEFLAKNVQAIRETIIAIPILFFIPNIIMAACMPIFLYLYAKLHSLLFGKPKERAKAKKSFEQERAELEFKEKKEDVLKQIYDENIRMQQYLLELQVLPKEIEKINSYESYKALLSRLEMMSSYVKSVGVFSDKSYRNVLEEEDVKESLSTLNIQRNAVAEKVKEYIKDLKKSKKQYEKPIDEEEFEEEDVEEKETEEEITEEEKETEERTNEKKTE